MHRPTNAWVQDLMCIQYKAPNLQYVGARFDKLPEYDIQICNARGAGHEICNAWVPVLMSIQNTTPNLRCTGARFDEYTE